MMIKTILEFRKETESLETGKGPVKEKCENIAAYMFDKDSPKWRGKMFENSVPIDTIVIAV